MIVINNDKILFQDIRFITQVYKTFIFKKLQ